MVFIFPNWAKMEMTDFQLCKNSNEVPGKISFRKDMKWEQFYSMIWIQSQKQYLGQLHQFLKFKNCLKIKALNAKL